VTVSRAAAKQARAVRRRRIGLGLLAFGVAGLVLIGAAAAFVLASLRAVEDAASGFEVQRTEILSMLGPASAALDGAASSASHAGASLEQTREAATQAAELMNRLATSFESLAELGEFDVFGTRPFASLSGEFNAVATQSRTLAANLADAATAMETNVIDSEAVAAQMRVLASQLKELEASLDPGHEGEGGGGTPPLAGASLPVAAAGFVLVGLLIWLAIPAIAAIWLGWRLSRPARAA